MSKAIYSKFIKRYTFVSNLALSGVGLYLTGNLDSKGIINEVISWSIELGVSRAISLGLKALGKSSGVFLITIAAFAIVSALDKLGCIDTITNFASECWSGLKSFFGGCGGGGDHGD